MSTEKSSSDSKEPLTHPEVHAALEEAGARWMVGVYRIAADGHVVSTHVTHDFPVDRFETTIALMHEDLMNLQNDVRSHRADSGP